jgi:hypothetical protein
MATVTKSISGSAESLITKIAWTHGFVSGLNEKSVEGIRRATPERLQGLVARLSPGKLPTMKGLSLSAPVIGKQVKLVRSILQSTNALGKKKAVHSA